MIKGRIISKIIVSIFFINLLSRIGYAQEVPMRPSFPSCVSPQGALKVTYSNGIHGVPGDFSTYQGQDTVYTLSETTLTQCLCVDNSKGIQTNWWKISSMSFEEIEYLKKLSWIYVPDGAAWGLDEGPYMAQSKLYNCGNGEDDDDDDDDDNDDDDHKESSSEPRIGGGEVLGVSTYLGDVLGLASTGNIVELAGLASLAIGSFGVLTYYATKKK